MKYNLVTFGVLILILSALALADENSSNLNISDSNLNVSDSNLSSSSNISNSGKLEVMSINPSSFQKGDAQFTIQILNNKSQSVQNLVGLVSGKGYSTYSLTPIDSLSPGQRGYFLVQGNFKESGIIELNIRIDGIDYKHNVTIIDNSEVSTINKSSVEAELINLKSYYSDVEQMINSKQDDGFDTSKINIEDSRKMMRDAESLLLSGKINEARVQIQLANEELKDQLSRLNKAGKVSTVSKLKDNAVIFSTIAGALIAFFTLYELLKKKSTTVVNKVKEVKINVVKDSNRNRKSKK